MTTATPQSRVAKVPDRRVRQEEDDPEYEPIAEVKYSCPSCSHLITNMELRPFYLQDGHEQSPVHSRWRRLPSGINEKQAGTSAPQTPTTTASVSS
jgi:hypothetical protein